MRAQLILIIRMRTPLMLSAQKQNVDRHNLAVTGVEGAIASTVGVFSPTVITLLGVVGAFVVRALGKGK